VGAVARKAIPVAVLGAVVLAAWPAAAWSRPQVLSRSPGTNARVAANARGDAAVVWESGPSRCPAACPALRFRVMLAVRRAGGRFRPAQVLGASDGGGYPRLGIGARGDVLVAWHVRSYVPVGPTAGRVRARWRSARGRLTRVQEVDPKRGANPDVAVSAAGDGVVVWEHEPVDAQGLLTADRVWAAQGPANGRLGAPQAVSQPGAPIVVVPPLGPVASTLLPEMNPRVALGADGTLVAVWRRTDGTSATCCQAVEAATGVPGRPFQAAERISAAVSYESVDGPAVAVGPDGSTLVAWDQFDRAGTASTNSIVAAWRDRGTSSFSAPQTLSGLPPPTGSWPARHPTVAAGRGGQGLVVWPGDNSQVVGGFSLVAVLEYAERAPGGGFGAQHALDARPNRDASSPDATIGPSGEPIVAWQRSTGIDCSGRPMPTCYASGTRPAVAIGAPPGREPTTLAREGLQPAVAAVPGGALVAWSGNRVVATVVAARPS
jgi:hypothetical protein